ncbi:MAG TPA: DMT family transporter [Acidobacteriaceae bacterium]|jgi:drug/metabolite transporter (DMT)-like permease
MRSVLRRSPVLAAHLLLLGVVLVWGTTFPIVKAALRDCSPLVFNLLRMVLATLALAAFNVRRLRASTSRDLLAGGAAGFFLALGYQFQTAGLARTSASKSAFITGLVVVIVPLLGSIPGVRPASMPRTRWNGYTGALLAFCGLVLLTTPAHAPSPLSGIGLGEILTLGCAVAFAAHLLTLARVSPSMDPLRLGTLQIAAATVFMGLTLPLGGHPHLHWTPQVAIALVITGLLATAAAFTIQSWAQQHLPATHTALIFTLEPVFAWLTSLFFLGERLDLRSLEGAGLILAGILLSELWPATSFAIPAAPGGL